MAINPLSIPYPDFRFDEIINPEAFDLNNDAIKTKVNEVVDETNRINDNGTWTNVSTQNGWYVFERAQYRKLSNGLVMFRGKLKPGILTAGVAPFVMPAGFRPAFDYDVITKMVNTSNGIDYTTLQVKAGGNTAVLDKMNVSILYLDGIVYLAEQ